MPPGLILVVGVGRSGTSLLQSMLNTHSAVTFPPETGYLRRYLPHRTLELAMRRGGLAAVRDTLRGDPNLPRLPFSTDELLQTFSGDDQVTDAVIYERLCTLLTNASGKPRVGDKDPRLVEYLPLIKAHWPDAYIIHIVRDPRDVVLSKKKAAWSRDHAIARHIFANRVQLKIGRKDGPALFGDHYVEVIYERLLTDPAAILESLCHTLELEYEPTMLDFSQSAKLLVSAEEMSWKKETLGPLLTTNSGQWQTGLAPWEAHLVEMACGEAMQVGNYQPNPSEGTKGWYPNLKALVQFVPMMILDPIYRAYRRWSLSAALQSSN